MVCERALRGRQPEFGFVAHPRIVLKTEMSLIAASDKAGARRCADRSGNIAIGAAHTGRRERIKVGRGHDLAPVNADVAVTEIVGENDEDVRRLCGDGDRQSSHQDEKSE